MKYYVIGVLQPEDGKDWVYVDSVVDAEPGRHIDAALLAGGARVGQTWRDWEHDPERGGWNYWLLAVIELSPGLPVVYSHGTAYAPQQYQDPSRGPLWAASGQDEAGESWAMKMYAQDEREVEAAVREHLNAEYSSVGYEVPEAMPDSPYGMVREDGGGRYTVFGPLGPPRMVSTHAWGIPLRSANPDFSRAELEYMRSVLDEIYFDPELDLEELTPSERARWGPVMRKLTLADHHTVSSGEWAEIAAHMPMSPDEDVDYPGLRAYVERLADPRQPPWGRRKPKEHVWGIPLPPARPRSRRQNATDALRRRLMP